MKKERERLGMDKDQVALLIMDVFSGQMTSPVLKVLPNNNNSPFQLKLSNIKPLHEMYNEMTSGERRKMCLKRWKVSGIKAAVESRQQNQGSSLSKLPRLDPFSDIDPMAENDYDIQTINARVISEASKYVSECKCDERIENDSDCE